MRLKTPAQDTAATYLRSLVAQYRRRGECRLPPIAKLAKAAGVATRTMWRAVTLVRAEGLVSSRPGRGITIEKRPAGVIPDRDLQRRTNAALPQKWEQVAVAMERDIMGGVFRPGKALPPTKALTERYGVSYRTLRKVLGALQSRRFVERASRGFRVRSFAVPIHQDSITLIVRGESPGNVRPSSSRYTEIFRAMEKECAEANLNLKITTLGFRGTRLVGPNGRTMLSLSREETSSTLGFIVWAQGLEAANLPNFALRLASYGKPVSVLDEMGNIDWRPVFNTQRNVAVFALGVGSAAGVDVGHYLLQLGHHHAAFISHLGRNVRLEGLRQVYQAAGLDRGIDAYLLHERLPGRMRHPGASPSLREQTQRLIHGRVDRRRKGHELITRALRASERELSANVGKEELYEVMLPLMEEALSHKEYTAWVAGNDDAALLCTRFLAERGVDMPGRISVIGFDDTIEASFNNLTSYNFNVASLVHAMLDHIARPVRHSSRRLKQPIEIEGFVTRRGSTSRAPFAASEAASE